MTAAHTPGPWAVSKPSGNYIDAPAIKGSIAALTYSAKPADAHLIAAAPVLLAAAQRMAAQLEGGNDFAEWEAAKAELLAAIAKAIGKETNA